MRQFLSKPRLLLVVLIFQCLCLVLFLYYRSFTFNDRLGGLFDNNVESKAEDATQSIDALSSPTTIGVIIAAVRANSNIEWIADVGKQNWEPMIYNVDVPYEGEQTLTVIRNKGHEAMVYLTYMIDNYDAFPPYAIFTHGHLHSWHQEADIDAIIRNIRLPAVDKAGYVSLRCDWYPSCPAELKLVHHDGIVWGPGVHRQDAEDAISGGAWQTFFPDTPMPETIASQCCAQFAVTRDAIRRNKKEDYVRMRQWILDTDLEDDVSGRVLEKLWAYIMTGREVNCPSPHTCACEYFGKCAKQKWTQPPAGLGPLPEDSRWP